MPGLKWHLIMSSLTITLGNHVKNQSSQLPTRWLAVTVFLGAWYYKSASSNSHHEQQPEQKKRKGAGRSVCPTIQFQIQKKTCQSHVSQGRSTPCIGDGRPPTFNMEFL